MKITKYLLLSLTFSLTALSWLAPRARAQAPFGNALLFNGANQYVTVTNFGSIIPTNEVTVEFWAYTTSPAAQSAFVLSPDVANPRFAAQLNNGGPLPDLGVTYWDFGNINTNGRLGPVNAPANSISNWVHYAFVASASGNFMSIYTNGNLYATKNGMSPFTPGSYDLYIGGIPGSNSYNGILDEFRVWNVALTQAQIQANLGVALTGNESNLVVYYRFDSTNGTVATNSAVATGAAYNGTLVNGPAWVAAGEPGGFALGTTNLLVGPAAGTNSVVLAAAGFNWTAARNVPWLHLSPPNRSGTGSTNVIFTIDANTNATRTGTLTIAGLTLSVTQAGAQYVAANPLTTLASGPPFQVPEGLAVDQAGNVYVDDYAANTIFEWSPVNDHLTTVFSGNIFQAFGVAVDGTGNVFVADTGDSAIKEWSPATSNLTTLVSTGLNAPSGVAVDGADDVYIGDYNNGAVKELPSAGGPVATLIPGLGKPAGVALDVAGNIYIGDSGNFAVYKWTAANSNLTTLASIGASGQNYPFAVAVDGSGNVYFEDYFVSSLNSVYKWTAATSNLTTVLSQAPHDPQGVAVDSAGNLYIADFGTTALEEIPNAYVLPTNLTESASGGSDALPPVLPATANLTGPFAPTSDSPWLTITGVTNGVVSFSFASSSSFVRTGNITLLGQVIPITQIAYTLGTSNLLEGPAAGSDSVVLAAVATNFPWTATANASWLHLSVANQSGPGSTNVVFSFDANTGATRSGTLTIAGQTLTITQAGAPYVAANPLTALATAATSGINNPASVAVDGAGNVYIADIYNHAIKKWSVANNTVTTLISGLGAPFGVALDGAGNVYIADQSSNTVYKWTANGGNLTTLISGLNYPSGVAVDSVGNVFVSDTHNNLVRKWSAASSNLTTLVSSNLSSPYGLAVDAAGNVYIANSGYGTITEWLAASSNLTTVVSGLYYGYGVAVDGAGHVYIADAGYNAITEWTPASNTMIELSAVFNFPAGVAVDANDNVYIADSANAAVSELPRAFVNPTAKTETANAGSDALPTVLPSTENLLAPFAPASDSAWLTISGVAHGVVSFAYAANNSPSRTGHITLLGQSIAVTQGDVDVPLILTGWRSLGNGSFQFSFTNDAAASFSVLSSTNVALPLSNWMVIGSPTNAGGNLFQFTTTPSTNDSQRFYRVVSP